MEKALLINKGIDQHDTDCSCGLCNSNGKSYGVSIYDASRKTLDVNNEEAVCDFVYEEDPYITIYAASEESAIHNARLECKEKNAQVIYSN